MAAGRLCRTLVTTKYPCKVQALYTADEDSSRLALQILHTLEAEEHRAVFNDVDYCNALNTSVGDKLTQMSLTRELTHSL